MGNLSRQLLEIWGGLPLGRRLTFALTVVGVLAGLGAFVWWSTTPTLAPLMTNLSSEDAAQIVEKLTAERTPFEIAAGGSAILVPENAVHALRLKVAGMGLPRGGGVGFEIFDRSSFGLSRFTEQVNYTRALEGELQRTLRQIDGVRDARVHIVPAERSLFRDEDRGARASVSLQLARGGRVPEAQVQAVVHLVASSVANLDTKDVTVIDDNGQVLARGGDPLHGVGAGLEHQRSLEMQLERRVTDIVERVVGIGHAEVRANVELDLSQTDKTTETFDPDTAVVRSQQVSEENRGKDSTGAGSGAAVGGIPGVRSNLAGGPTPPQTDEATRSGRRTETKNFELSKVVNHEIKSQGRVSRLSVAVLVDASEEAGADGVVVKRPRTTESLAQVTALVKSAVGFNAERGDVVEVQSLAFEPVAVLAPTPEPALAWLPLAERLRKLALPAALVAAAAAWILRRRRGSAPLLVGAPRTVRELEATLAHGQALPASSSFSALSPSANPDPVKATAVVRTWLEES